MAKQKYIYDSSKVNYIPIKRTFKQKLQKRLLILGVGVFVGVVTYGVSGYLGSTPKEEIQAELIKDLKVNQGILTARIKKAYDKLGHLESYDDSLYRTMLGSNAVSPEIRNAGTGGVDKYEELEGNPGLKDVVSSYVSLDKLVAKMNVQEESYHTLFREASSNMERMEHLPAIIPIANWSLKRIGSGFSPRRYHPILGRWRAHKGIDLVAPRGTKIFAPADGVVKVVRVSSSFGKELVIDHGFGIETLYAHMSNFNCKVNEVVKRGQLVGFVGTTGLSTGPHLHYEVHLHGVAVNPVDYFFSDISSKEYKTILEQTKNITVCME